MSACMVSQWGTQPMSPEFWEREEWLNTSLSYSEETDFYSSGTCVCVCVRACVRACVWDRGNYLKCLLKVSGLAESRVFTRPNNCITLSSCLRSSCPFKRNMYSFPLLPAEQQMGNHRNCSFGMTKYEMPYHEFLVSLVSVLKWSLEGMVQLP